MYKVPKGCNAIDGIAAFHARDAKGTSWDLPHGAAKRQEHQQDKWARSLSTWDKGPHRAAKGAA